MAWMAPVARGQKMASMPMAPKANVSMTAPMRSDAYAAARQTRTTSWSPNRAAQKKSTDANCSGAGMGAARVSVARPESGFVKSILVSDELQMCRKAEPRRIARPVAVCVGWWAIARERCLATGRL